ncbi:MAG: hypothetical protein HYZ75_19180 [Elusimicrobia bacterium]|nr:hypothetical protein [Elusimicrobiota bacterium]
MTFLIAALLGIGLPVIWWNIRESRLKNPAVRWPELAAQLELQFVAEPPRLEGKYKGRSFRVLAEGSGASVMTGLRGRPGLRVEIGSKDKIEKEAGMVVPDRVKVNDHAFEKRYLARCQPADLAEMACDHSLRQRLLSLPVDVHILALPDRVVVNVPFPTEASEIRNYLDLAVSMAESLS